MKKHVMVPVFFLFFFNVSYCQADSTEWLRAFPITAYIVDLNDSTKLVQLEMPEGHIIKYGQIGLVRGVYKNSHSDTVQKGYGRCYLMKGAWYYFAISNNNSGSSLKEGDLLYTFMKRTSAYYGRILKLASHFIQLQDVYENRFFDRYTVFLSWRKEDETALIDSMAKDVRFTGNYFLENDTSMNRAIEKGVYKGQRVLTVMAACKPADIMDFIDYVIARPNLYAGRQWKLAEVFATWAAEGAPALSRQE